MKTNLAQKKISDQIADIEFIFSECLRQQKLLADTPPAKWKDLPREELLGSLPHPSGFGLLGCSFEAEKRIWKLAEQALNESDAVQRITPQGIYSALKVILVDRFLKEKRPLDEKQVARALASAVRQAKSACDDTTHFIPCRLMYEGSPEPLTIGPVSFIATAKFNELMANSFESFVARESKPEEAGINGLLLSDTRRYYDDFTWIARVTIFSCDADISQYRADMAVTAALNFLHALFGPFHTRRMNIGGPRIGRDERARLTLDGAGRLGVSCSSGATSAVGFLPGWEKELDGPLMAVMLRCAAKAVEPVANPEIRRPLGSRLVDAAAWYGDAVREQSTAAKVIKAITGLEALVVTAKHKDISKIVAERGAALAYHPFGKTPYCDLEKDLRRAYDLRSRLTHGSLSPFDPTIEKVGASIVQLTCDILCSGLELFESQGFIDEPCTAKQLGIWLDKFVEWAKAHSEARQLSAPSNAEA